LHRPVGHAFATRFLSLSPSKRVVIAGRREAKLDEFAANYPKERVEKVVMDITDFASLKDKVAQCMSKVRPARRSSQYKGSADGPGTNGSVFVCVQFGGEIDCVYAGSGVQRAQDFTKLDGKTADKAIQDGELENLTNWVRSFPPPLSPFDSFPLPL
jgi:hypothetical protein